jgi:hypothetical protein
MSTKTGRDTCKIFVFVQMNSGGYCIIKSAISVFAC